MKKHVTGVLLCCGVVFSGCGAQSEKAAVAPESESYSDGMYGAQYGSTNGVNGVAADGSGVIDPLLEEARRMLKDVFFTFESAELDPAAQAQLKSNAAWLLSNPSVTILIEGHCDERGTSEFNMALGERRADTVQNFLVKFGVQKSRMQTVSFGEERPFNSAQGETAWAENRRAHFVVQ
ncbi:MULTISPECIES: peptidoglycan-associated lipoprotein Pal [Prosthecochloris]|nr:MULTISPECIES: peptidoglycan-associated lipoprotein Pal [Prosthecochloris]ANT65323.1 Minor outer membrane protein Omp16 [Prosthecochloris sp. CIB 2401]